MSNVVKPGAQDKLLAQLRIDPGFTKELPDISPGTAGDPGFVKTLPEGSGYDGPFGRSLASYKAELLEGTGRSEILERGPAPVVLTPPTGPIFNRGPALVELKPPKSPIVMLLSAKSVFS